MTNSPYSKLKKFFENNKVAQRIVEPLKEGATARVEFEGDKNVYTLVKKGGKPTLLKKTPEKQEVVFVFSEEAVDYIISVKSDDVKDYVKALNDCVLFPTKTRWMRFKLTTTLIDAWRKGYMNMLKLGGKDAMKTVAKLGIKIPSRFLKS